VPINPIRAGHAARALSWMRPPKRSRRRRGDVRNRVWMDDRILAGCGLTRCCVRCCQSGRRRNKAHSRPAIRPAQELCAARDSNPNPRVKSPLWTVQLRLCGVERRRVLASSRTTSYLHPVYTPPTARTGRLAGAHFPGAAVYALPTARTIRPTDRAAAAGNDGPGHSRETSQPQEATEQDGRSASATSRRTDSKRASTLSRSRSMQPPRK
jgi:hypothetical protein